MKNLADWKHLDSDNVIPLIEGALAAETLSYEDFERICRKLGAVPEHVPTPLLIPAMSSLVDLFERHHQTDRGFYATMGTAVASSCQQQAGPDIVDDYNDALLRAREVFFDGVRTSDGRDTTTCLLGIAACSRDGRAWNAMFFDLANQ